MEGRVVLGLGTQSILPHSGLEAILLFHLLFSMVPVV